MLSYYQTGLSGIWKLEFITYCFVLSWREKIWINLVLFSDGAFTTTVFGTLGGLTHTLQPSSWNIISYLYFHMVLSRLVEY